MRSNGQYFHVAAEVFDDILIPAPLARAKGLVEYVGSRLRRGTIVYLRTSFVVYGSKIEQQPNMMVTMSSPKKLTGISECSIDRDHRKQRDTGLNSDEIPRSQGLNGKLCWIAPILIFSAFLGLA